MPGMSEVRHEAALMKGVPVGPADIRAGGSEEVWRETGLASAYATRFDTSAARVFGYPFVLEALAVPTPPRTVVDFGCGPGTAAALAADQWDCHVYAVDSSHAMLELGRQTHRAPSIEFRHVAPGALEFLPDASVDAVMCTLVMATIQDVDMMVRVIAEAHRVLAPGGRFALLEGHPDGVGVEYSMKRPVPGRDPVLPGDPWPVQLKTTAGPWLDVTDYYWDLPTYLRILEDAGFQDLGVVEPMLESAKERADPDDLAAASWDTERTLAPYVVVSGCRR
ncbi:class I SAM-dependent methyltransferase [Streptomyces rubiginosohelvolus]|uniref:class I SAM-dependent methyltransferase n=1 Tax=Streptomyces rubiginosohelvolus TaxID=67362 RepID=UPI0036B88BB8